ncbi:MAG: hypothetical protein AAF703_20625 [Cyanobacteria bacterium P01_D01_bin.105]
MWLLFKKAYPLLLLCGTALATTACISKHKEGDILRTTDYSVAPYSIMEEVQYDYSDFWDDYYQRVYVVESPEGKTAFRGATTMWDVEATLAGQAPMVVGDWLAVFSLGQVWIWQPGEDAIAFEPMISLESDVWRDNGLEKPMNAADYVATGFQIKDGEWILEYTDMFLYDESSPEEKKHIYFVSKDQGQTFLPQP